MSSVTDRRSPLLKTFAWSFLILWLFLAAFPFLWTFWGSFKVEGDFFSKADWSWAVFGHLTQIETDGAFTGGGYHGAWIEEEFWRAAMNTIIVVFFTVTISLTLGLSLIHI